MLKQIKRALISVSNKTSLLELSKVLNQLNIQILATDGTAKFLKDSNIPVTKIANYIEFPEIMSGRVKTLHPKIYGGLLGRSDIDYVEMKKNNILEIDLLIVNLYPFTQKIRSLEITIEDAIRNIDIGGPTMLRAAAKNYKYITVICNPCDYDDIKLKLIETKGKIDLKTRFSLACKAFKYTAAYEDSIANYFEKISQQSNNRKQLPTTLNFQFYKKKDMRYGENPHQQAALYLDSDLEMTSTSTFKQLQGKTMSYNNIIDADVALKCVNTFDLPSCVIVKHNNPCGVACNKNIEKSYINAFNSDPVSAFGGIIAFNHLINENLAKKIIQQFVEIVIAPNIDKKSLKIFSNKKNIRLLIYNKNNINNNSSFEFKKINDGILVQMQDQLDITPKQLQIVTKRSPSNQELNDLIFSWKVVKYTTSNAIVYAKKNKTIGIGAGQMSRIFSANIAIEKAKEAKVNIIGSVMASDAFIPFTDIINFISTKGITAVIQPGGSIRDQEVINAANNNNIAMIFTGVRHFKH